MIPRPFAATAALLFTAMALAGCSSSSDFDPAADVKETGRTVELSMKVVDLFDTEVYPGLKANLWAFCVTPFDPGDAYSAAAISYFSPLPTDGPKLGAEEKSTCSVPAPTITVTQGDRVIVHFQHTHFHPHTIHWHGQYVPEAMDGVPGITQQAVGGAGGIADYTYDFIAKRAGTLWYHCHVDTHLHVMQGLYGMFIVKPASTKLEPKVDSEAVMVLSTMSRNIVEAIPGVNPHAHQSGCFTSGTPNCQNPPIDTSRPDVFLINGHSYPLTEHQEQSIYHVDEGKALRIRMLNAGETVEEVHLHGHDMLVVAIDGNPLPLSARYWVDTVSIGPAQRFDVVVYGNNPGLWAFHTHVNAHEANDQQVPGGMHTMLVDGPMPADMHPFPSELAGGQPYQERVYIPGDFSNGTQVQTGLSIGGLPAGTPATPATGGFTFAWPIPIDMVCAVDTISFDATLSGTVASTQASDLGIKVVDPTGFELFSGALGEGVTSFHRSLNNTAFHGLYNAPAVPPEGKYLAQVTGTAAQGLLTMNVHVDYFSSFDEVTFMHRVHKIPLCGKYGQGTNGVEVKAPPP
ncbi:MAG TPA: multicopper oxidase domain-containing protein [Candidatus Thermoplasmatota archaeon]|nr:multicopper oxidase domain-containing protein [Candidatus Thermoplasmatota archaeon]